MDAENRDKHARPNEVDQESRKGDIGAPHEVSSFRRILPQVGCVDSTEEIGRATNRIHTATLIDAFRFSPAQPTTYWSLN